MIAADLDRRAARALASRKLRAELEALGLEQDRLERLPYEALVELRHRAWKRLVEVPGR